MFGLFATLITFMPSEFLRWGVEAKYQDKEAAEFFNAHNVTAYNYTIAFNLTFGESHTEEFGLPGDEKLEFWWNQFYVMPGVLIDMFQLRHTNPSWFFGAWREHHKLKVEEPYATKANVLYPNWGLRREEFLALTDDETQVFYCEFSCEHINAKVGAVPYNASWSMAESWDNGKLKIYVSYKVDWEKTGLNMWTIIWNLLQFRNVELGIPGVGGQIITVAIGLALWACIAIITLALVTAFIPFIPGWRGGE